MRAGGDSLMSELFTKKLNRRRLVQTGAAAGAFAAAHRFNIVSAQGAQKVTVLMWSNSPTIDANFENRAAMFNEAHAGQIEVDLQFLPYTEYWQKVQLAYAANKPYDVYFWDVQAYGHFKNNLLLPLQPMIDAAKVYDPAQYPTDLFTAWQFDGQSLYGMPENLQTNGLYYNKTLFDAAGLAVPDDTWTWQQVVEAAKGLTQRRGERVTQWGMTLGNLGVWWGLQTISWAKGAAFFDKAIEPTKFQFSDPMNVETLKFAQDLIHTEGVAPTPAVTANSPDTTNFASGRIGMVFEGSWNISSFAELPFEWGIVPGPKWGETRVVPYWMGGWVIAKASPVAEAAFEWARWSATDYQPQMAADHDWIPIRNDDRASEAMLSGMPAGFKQVTDALAEARLGDFYSANNQQIWTEAFDPNLTQLYNGEKSPEDTAAAIDAAANALL